MQLILKLTEDKRNHIANERKRKRTRREMITMIEGMKKKEGKKEILIMVGLIGMRRISETYWREQTD